MFSNKIENIFFPTTIDNTVGLMNLIHKAVGPNNFRNIHPEINPERFKIGNGARKVNLELAPFLNDENGKQAANRLMTDGYNLEGIGELAQFMADNQGEVGRYVLVIALSEASRWTASDGDVFVPYAFVIGANRYFSLCGFRDQFGSNPRVLVSRPGK